MKNYTSDTYLLSPEFQPIAHGWDSMVFIDKQDPSVILKLYDPLNLQQVQKYYQIQREIAQKSGVIKDEEIELRSNSDKFMITENEDGVLVVLPKAEGVNLGSYGSDIQRTRIVNRVKDMLRMKGLPTTGGFEVKPENIMVSDRQGGKRLILHITDVGARVDECIKEYPVH